MSQMRGTTVLWGQFLVVFMIAALSLQAATQYVAHALAYQTQLGQPAYVVLGLPVYWPWKYWEWMFFYDYYAKSIFFRGSFFIYGGVFFAFIVIAVMSLLRARKSRNPDTYGTARWAVRRDLEKAGLLASSGIVVAQTQDRHRQLVRHAGSEHCFVFAPTRSGKGVGIVIPTLLSWLGSVIVYDMKRENWDITAGWRRKFSRVLRFEPTATHSVRFNPLLEVRMGENEVRDVQNIADILIDPDGSKQNLSHWDMTAHALLVGCILHVLYAEKDKTLSGVANFISDPQRPFVKTLRYMMACPHLGEQVHGVVASTARELLNKSENELSGVISTAMSFLSLYRDPVIARNTSVSDFAITDLMNADHPVSLYLVIPPSDVDRTKPLIRLMLNQIGRRLTENMGETGTKPHKHDLLMLLDEFPSLGRLAFFETELAYMAGYGIRALMIAQSLNQIEQAYGAKNSILDNSHLRVTFGTLDDGTAKRISDMLGTATESKRQTNYAGHRLAPWLGHVMVSEQESARPLLTPGEVLQFPADEALVMAGGSPPYRALKLRYFQDKRFTDRMKLPRPDEAAQQAKEYQGLGNHSAWLHLKPKVRKGIASSGTQASKNAYELGGVMLEEETDGHLEKGRVQELSITEKHEPESVAIDLPELDEAMREQQEKEAQRKRQVDRQRMIELSRSPNGGGMPL